MIECVLCMDIGTTSLKAGLISAAGEVVSFCIQKYSDNQNRYISLQWMEYLKNTIVQMKENCDWSEIDVKAIAISGNGPTLVTQNGLTYKWNEHITWQLFERYSAEANTHLRKSLFLPRIVMVKHLFPEEFDEGILFSGPEFLIYQLTGKAITILPEKRFETAYWTEENLNLCNIPSNKMPPYVGIGEVCGYLKNEYAEYLGLQTKIPVISGGPDFVVALIGTNTLSAGKICDRAGSSEGFNFCVDKFIFAEGVRSLPSVIPGLWNISVLIPESGKNNEKQRLQKCKDAVDLLKKVALENNIGFPKKITATGGQTKSEEYMAKKAITLGIPVSICQIADAELLGDACASWFAIGKYDSILSAANSMVRETKTYENL